MQSKKMFKVISPIERRDGSGKWWMRCGTAFANKDDSINVYIEALPLAGMAKGEGVTLQLREYTEAELRERSEKRASYQARTPLGPNGVPAGLEAPLLPGDRGGRGDDGRDHVRF